jgi:vanillate O-demethylase ferredoxin subunit
VPQAPDTIATRVAGRRTVAAGVVELELKSADGKPLPAFEPGAHIDVNLAGGLMRQYSLANFQPAPDSYTIAVSLADASRGGSRYVHDSIAVGDVLRIGLPRNSFPLDPKATGYTFIAGGIGITPILSMVRWCEMARKPWRLLYAARSRTRAAYVEELAFLGGERARLHFDDEAGHVADLASFLARLRRDEQVYCCGPEPLMQVVAAQTATHPVDCVHFERFSVSAAPAGGYNRPFRVRLKSSGRELEIGADSSILDALEQAGIDHPFACREGLCRSCETEVCSGLPDHRDYVLSDTEKASNRMMMVCVSRARDGYLELNL